MIARLLVGILTSLLQISLIASLTADEHVELAKRHLVAQRYTDALTEYDNAIQQDDTNYLYYFKRATTFLSIGQTKSALKDFTTVLNLKPDFDHILLQKAKLYLSEGEFDKSLADLKKYTSTPTYTPTPEVDEITQQITASKNDYQDALAKYKEKKYDLAIEGFGRVLNTCPHFINVRMMRAECFFETGDLEMAAGDFIRASNLQPNNIPALLKLSQIRLSLGEVAASVTSLKECLRFDPDQKECKKLFKLNKKFDKEYTQLVSYMEKKLYRKVIAAIHKSAKPNDSLLARAEFRSIGGQVRLKLFEFSCIAYSELGVKENQKDVENWCDKTLEIDEENIEALIRRAEVYMLKEEYEDAMRDFKKAYELNKTDARASEGYNKAQKLHRQAGLKNYYKVLGVDKQASKRQIKKAFRNLAKEWHPDKYTGDDPKGAAKRYNDINEAYEVLSNDELRARFDNGDDPNSQEQHHHHHHGGFNFQGGHQFFQQGHGGGNNFHFSW